MKKKAQEILRCLMSNWALFVFVWVVLFMPFFFAITIGSADAKYRIGINALYAVLVYIVLLITQDNIRKYVMTIIILLSYAPNMIVQSFLIMDNTIMKSSDFWVVFNTNPAEAAGFFSSMPSSVVAWGITYTIAILITVILCHWTAKSCGIQKWPQLLALIIIGGISLLIPFRTTVPMTDFYKSFYKYSKEKKEVQQFFDARKNLRLDVECFLPKGKKTFVIVIGESQNRQHMQLYGYGRETSPLLTEIRDQLSIYTDCCSPAVQTLPSMKQILTFANYMHPDMYKEEASIIEILKSAGYKTYWYDNQGGKKNGAWAIDAYTPTSYRTIASMSDVFVVEEGGKKDSILFHYLDEALDDSVSNKVIFMHIIGNHFDYRTRYEESFEFFTDTIGIETPFKSQLSKTQFDNLNAYDNATRYNDYVIRTFIEKLQKQDGMSALLYFSDHGSDVYDYHAQSSRSFDRITPAMCEIPLILWQNELYKYKQHLTINEQMPVCTDDIIYAIMDLTGVRYALYDSCRSMFSEKYIPKERHVQGIQYDDISAQSSIVQ